MIGRGLGDGALMDRPALPLIGGEELGAAPAAERCGELPAEIDGVADPHIHAEAAEGRVQVAGIARQEHAVAAVAIGDEALRDPGVGRDDLEIEITEPGATTYQVLRIETGEINAVGEPGRHEVPEAVLIHGPQQRRHRIVHHPIHDGGTQRVPRCERGCAKDDAVILRKAAVADHGCADSVAHRAVRAIRADEGGGADLARRAGGKLGHRGDDAVRGGLERAKLGVEADRDTGERGGMRAEHLLQHVLRDPLGFLGIEVVPLAATVERVLEARQQRPVHARREHHGGRIVRRDRRGAPQRVGNAPAAQMLARAHIGGLGARTVTDAIVALDDEAATAAPAELDRRGETDRAGAGDEDVDVVGRVAHQRCCFLGHALEHSTPAARAGFKADRGSLGLIRRCDRRRGRHEADRNRSE